ncbi:uncharacterized protein [Nicotiana tomentosiformis]|uniref:uncharacterized protein n=1 Tax=Nicotiana tomentosiformis TaxID=4098 RepID=UPI00051AD830|nr:uncharacterized protein LOC104115560 [Nicotiana tomentosiformis]
MKQKQEIQEEQDLEILKAVAQAWHGHSSSLRTAVEFDPHCHNFKSKPSRFKLEAMSKVSTRKIYGAGSWDFKQSLWDSYELVNVSKKLEMELMLDHPLSALDELNWNIGKKHEGEKSLRDLFNMSSRRFNEAELPKDKGLFFF